MTRIQAFLLVAAALSCVGVVSALSTRSVTSDPDMITHLPDYGPLRSTNYAGYVNLTHGRRAFYWFVESENKPASDPLVLWLTGGPGCSSLVGALAESGPYQMRHGGKFERNEFTWASVANMLYLESPPGVGFSVDTVPPVSWNDSSTAEYNYNALKGWLKKFPQFRSHKFYIAGESYGGHYVPQLADKILTGDDTQLRSMMQGFMVGNPCTGDIGCANDDPTLYPFLSYHGFWPLNKSIEGDLNTTFDPYDILAPSCVNDDLSEYVRFPHPVMDAYKKRRQREVGDAPATYGPCAMKHITNWINRDDVKAAIHAEPDITWDMCSFILNYTVSGKSVTDLYAKFFDQTNWSIMIYSGTADIMVNFVQTQTIVNDMNRPLSANNKKFTPWNYPDVYTPSKTQLGGFYLQYDRLSWAGVRDAGHMVPMYNPPPALELFRSFLTLGRPGRL